MNNPVELAERLAKNLKAMRDQGIAINESERAVITLYEALRQNAGAVDVEALKREISKVFGCIAGENDYIKRLTIHEVIDELARRGLIKGGS